MTKQEAIRRASQVARESGHAIYVVWDNEEQGYGYGPLEALDTFYAGCEPVWSSEDEGR